MTTLFKALRLNSNGKEKKNEKEMKEKIANVEVENAL